MPLPVWSAALVPSYECSPSGTDIENISSNIFLFRGFLISQCLKGFSN